MSFGRETSQYSVCNFSNCFSFTHPQSYFTIFQQKEPFTFIFSYIITSIAFRELS